MSSVLLIAALYGCADDATRAGADAPEALRIDEGSPEAMGILAFLNDPGTTFQLLDIDVALDARAAESLIEHRDGPDATFGTADDDPYDTIAEVDDQYYVGSSALNKLLNYVDDNGWIPDPSGTGNWEGVDFTADEITWTLEVANNAPLVVLDDDVPLDSRAANNIVADRPIVDMDQLAAVSWVGKSALTSLRDFAIASGGWAADPGAGVGETCDTSDECADGLYCMGEIAYGNGIFCVDTWGVFPYTTAQAIPDAGAPLVTSVDVQGLASVPVDVVLTVDIDHPRKSDLVLSIHNFNGYGETLWLNEASPSNELVVRAFPSDDAVHGLYTVTVEDTVAGEAGTLNGWELFIVSTYD